MTVDRGVVARRDHRGEIARGSAPAAQRRHQSGIRATEKTGPVNRSGFRLESGIAVA